MNTKRSRWADTGALGATMQRWCAERSSDAIGNVVAEASDRELFSALEDWRIAQADGDGLDARTSALFGEIEDRLWRANGGPMGKRESERVSDEKVLEGLEGRPEYEKHAAVYKKNWKREAHNGDCACPACLPDHGDPTELTRLRGAVAWLLALAHAACKVTKETAAQRLGVRDVDVRAMLAEGARTEAKVRKAHDLERIAEERARGRE